MGNGPWQLTVKTVSLKKYRTIGLPKVWNVLLVLECKLEDANATVWPLRWWLTAGIISTLRSGVTSADPRHESILVDMLLQFFPYTVVYRIQVKTVDRPQRFY